MVDGEVSRYLGSLQREECYRVDAVLKESPHEITQRVFFVGANGSESGPYIRKFIRRDSGIGGVYERLDRAQRGGHRFKYIPDILECYANDDSLVVVMELAAGLSLGEVVEREGGSADLAVGVFPRLCDAVSELHEELDPPVIHRDLTPSNVVVSEGGLALIDFGIAREYREGADEDTTHFGTRAFAPPEQFGFGQTTVRSDVYALGLMLYFCLTGRVPDSGARSRGFADPCVPAPFADIVAKAASFSPDARYASARELKEAFLASFDMRGDAAPSSAFATQPGAVPAPANAHAVSPSASAASSFTPMPQPQPAAPYTPNLQKPRSRARDFLGIAWNVCVILTVVACVAVCLYEVPFPTGEVADRPFHYIVILNGILLPAFFMCAGYLCLDKSRLRERVPALANVKWWHVAVGYIVLFLALAVLEAFITMVFG